MSIAGAIITLICGIMIVVSIFLPWFNIDFGWGMGSMSISAWDGISASIGDSMDVFLVFLGGILMAVFAIPAFIVSLASSRGKAAVITLGIFAIVGSLAAIGGSVWFLIDAVRFEAMSMVGYGFWIAIAAAIIGFIFAILTAAFARNKGDW